MKNPILALMAILALICSGLLYAAPALRDRNATNLLNVDGAEVNPQIRVEGAPPVVGQQPPATIGQPPAPRIEGENPLVPPPIAAPKKEGPIRRILPPYRQAAPRANANPCCPPQYTPQSPQYVPQSVVPSTYYVPTAYPVTTFDYAPGLRWGERYTIAGPNIFHPFSTVERSRTRNVRPVMCCPNVCGPSCMECY